MNYFEPEDNICNPANATHDESIGRLGESPPTIRTDKREQFKHVLSASYPVKNEV